LGGDRGLGEEGQGGEGKQECGDGEPHQRVTLVTLR
jgi:hypothetical protein